MVNGAGAIEAITDPSQTELVTPLLRRGSAGCLGRRAGRTTDSR